MGKFKSSLFAQIREAKNPKMKTIKVSNLPKDMQEYAQDLLKIASGKVLYSAKENEVFDLSIEYPGDKANKILKSKDYVQVIK